MSRKAKANCPVCSKPIIGTFHDLRKRAIRHLREEHPLRYAQWQVLEMRANQHKLALASLNVEALQQFGLPLT